MSNLQTYYHFKLEVDQHTGDKWLIHGTKRHKDNQLQHSRRMSRGRNIQGVVHLQNQNYLCKGSLKCRSKGN